MKYDIYHISLVKDDDCNLHLRVRVNSNGAAESAERQTVRTRSDFTGRDCCALQREIHPQWSVLCSASSSCLLTKLNELLLPTVGRSNSAVRYVPYYNILQLLQLFCRHVINSLLIVAVYWLFVCFLCFWPQNIVVMAMRLTSID